MAEKCLLVKEKLTSFPPLYSAHSRVLIVGSMPGVQSLKRGQYYAHPQNQFWRILASLFGVDPPETYPLKKALLTKYQIALWDVVGSCERDGSLDSAICNAQPNDFTAIFKRCPSLRAVGCNGQTAFQLFTRLHGKPSFPVIALPSTSPAYTISFEKKLARWRKILEYLNAVS